MCGICGCADGESHTHVMPDGRIVVHSHAEAAEGHHHHENEKEHHHHPGEDGHHHHGEHHHHHHGEHHHHHHHGETHAALRGERGPQVESLEAKILGRNDHEAEHNRSAFAQRDLFVINVMSSPGSGKTTFLERAVRELETPVAVLEGDQETTNDADRIRSAGARATQINTGAGCHLEASMVRTGLEVLDPSPGTLLVIENVGNLVCPALFDLGEHARVVLFSVTEGEDKPLKYPQMFRVADLVLLTKCDLLPHLDFDEAKAREAVAEVNPDATILNISARTGAGMGDVYGWLSSRRQNASSAG